MAWMGVRWHALRGSTVAWLLVHGCGGGGDADDAGETSDGTVGLETTTGATDDPGDDTPVDVTSASTGSGDEADTTSGDDDDDDDHGEDETGACDEDDDACLGPGALIWEHTHASGLGGTDEATGVAIDPASDAYVAGWVATEANGQDIWLRRYGAPGSLVWTRTFDGPASGNDRAHGVARGPDGSIFVAGYVAISASRNDVWLGRYDADGNQIWARTYAGSAGTNDQGWGVAADATGVVVAGFHTVWVDDFSTTQQVFVRKYDMAGAILWTDAVGGHSGDSGRGVATDAAGNVIVVGHRNAAGQGRDIWVRKYGPGGNVLWTRTHDGPDSTHDEAHGVAVDNDDEILVAGFEGVAGLAWRWWLRRYDAAGDVMWTRTYDGATEEGARASGVSVTGTGIAVVTGVEREEGFDHVVVRKYGPDGFELWTTTVRGVGETHQTGAATAVGADGRSYAVGGMNRGVDGRDAWIGRFAP
jgi:hypothetical protein